MERMKKIEKTLDRISKEFYNFGLSVGLNAETFFIDATENGLVLGGIKFKKFANNYVLLDPEDERQENKSEIDIILKNRKYFLLIEVKYQLVENDIKQAIKNARLFKNLHPKIVKDKTICLAFATFGVRPQIKKRIIDKGFYILTQKNEKLNIHGDRKNKNIKGF